MTTTDHDSPADSPIFDKVKERLEAARFQVTVESDPDLGITQHMRIPGVRDGVTINVIVYARAGDSRERWRAVERDIEILDRKARYARERIVSYLVIETATRVKTYTDLIVVEFGDERAMAGMIHDIADLQS
jgi:hypothetical protein